ncbi:tryptophan synthase subunit beta [Sulfitobacter sp. W002]|jgi:ABC-type proline/glycine betaine transport system substrate-binding protein|uniref:tryptophan synthase subunit beta n=1 Tax=unclassified Sulfitobacter TaxID=196795 RepID=UPI0021A55C3D|nr:tryptophan synthase subunit beta [Sulfitobacter sp. W002]UWR30881.1 tryptophan synthase subunit beta [Sulfitobacter sp. W002]
MKNAFATAALILATAGTAAFAQGMEGQQVGYTADNADAAYSTRNVTSDALNLDDLRAETPAEATATVFVTTQDAQKDGRFVR